MPSMRLWIFAVVSLVVLGGIGFGIWKLALQNTHTSKFFSSYKKTDSFAKETIKASVVDFSALSEAVKNNNIAAAEQISEDSLTKSLKNTNRIAALEKQTIELKTQSFDISNGTTSPILLKLFSLLDSRNQELKKLLTSETDLFTALRLNYFFVKNGANGLNLSSADKVSQDIVQSEKNIEGLQIQIDETYQKLLEAAGVSQNAIDTTGEDIQAGYKNTQPQELPVVLPTLPEIQKANQPPIGPLASPSATPSIATSSAASSSAH